MRKRPSGGGTLRRKSPQQGQRPSLAIGPVTSTRSQWPRASHNGLMHCTVKPGKYCIVSPQWPHKPGQLARQTTSKSRAAESPKPRGGPAARPRSPEGERLARDPQLRPRNRGPRGNSELDGAHFALSTLWCQEKNTTRYCGKVAPVKNLIFVRRSYRDENTLAPQRSAKRSLTKRVGNREAHFYVLKNEGGAASCFPTGPQDGGKNAWSKV